MGDGRLDEPGGDACAVGAAIVLAELTAGYAETWHDPFEVADVVAGMATALEHAARAAWGCAAAEAWQQRRLAEEAAVMRSWHGHDGSLDDARAVVTAQLAGMTFHTSDAVGRLVASAEAEAAASNDGFDPVDVAVWAMRECATSLAAAATEAGCIQPFVAALRAL